MEKKLTAQGPSGRKSYTVTLPLDWVKNQGLIKTKSVDLDIIGSKVVISSDKLQEGAVVINCKDYSKSIINVVSNLYRTGVNEVKFEKINEEALSDITRICETRLIGYEIIEHKKDHVLVKDITRESHEDFKTIFRRIFLLLLELSNSENPSQVEALVKNIRKFKNYSQRMLMKRGHAEFNKTPIYYLVLDRLAHLANQYSWLLRNPSSKRPAELKEIGILLRTAYELFYSFDTVKYGLAQDRTYRLIKQIETNSDMDVTTMYLHNAAVTLNSLHGDIFSLKYDEKK